MTETNETLPIDVLDVARKQRYVHLLGKVKSGEALSKSEIEELEQYERQSTDSAKKPGRKKTIKVVAGEVFWTQAEAAQYVGRDVRTIRRWLKAGMLTVKEGDRVGYVRNILDIYRENEGQRPSEDKGRQQKAEADLKEIKAKLARLELGIKEGELIPREHIETDRVARITAAKRGFLGLGRKVAARLPPRYRRAVQTQIDEEIRIIIEGFAKR